VTAGRIDRAESDGNQQEKERPSRGGRRSVGPHAKRTPAEPRAKKTANSHALNLSLSMRGSDGAENRRGGNKNRKGRFGAARARATAKTPTKTTSVLPR